MRLLQYMKDAIQSKAIAQKFKPLEAELDAAEVAYATKVYDAIPGIEQVANAPVGWLPQSSTLKILFDGWAKSVSLGESEKRLPYQIFRYGVCFESGSPEHIAHVDLEQRRAALQQYKGECREEIRRVLAGVSTLKRLKEVWPEAADFLPPEAPPPPAIQTADRLRELLYKGATK